MGTTLLAICFLGWKSPLPAAEPVNFEVSSATVRRTAASDWNQYVRIEISLLGVEAFDPLGFHISWAPAERFFWHDDNWYPVDGYKHSIVGKLAYFSIYDGLGEEMDWNLNIIPNPFFQWSIQDLPNYADCSSPSNPCDWSTADGEFTVQSEVTPHASLYHNRWFPKDRPSDCPLTGREVGVYGAWVRDEGHGSKPEIHPAEFIWWRDGEISDDRNVFWMMVIQDDADRFSDEDSFDFGGAPRPFDWRPWAGSPRHALFRIPFYADRFHPVQFTISPPEPGYSRFAMTPYIPGVGIDSDDGSEHQLIYDGELLVRATESRDDDIGVRFVRLTQLGDGVLGYLELRLAVGDPLFGGAEGYYVFNVVREPLLSAAPSASAIPAALHAQPAKSPVGLVAHGIRNSLVTRTDPAGQPQLFGNVTITVEAASNAPAADQTIRSVEFLIDGKRAPAQFQGAGPQSVTVTDVPLLQEVVIVCTTTSGIPLEQVWPGLAIAARIPPEQVVDGPEDTTIWPGYAALAGLADPNPLPPATLFRGAQTTLGIEPFYAVRKDGRPSQEEDSPFVEEILEALNEDNPQRRTEIFGRPRPFEITWTFKGATAEGEAVPTGMQPVGGDQIGLQVTAPTETRSAVTVFYPTNSASHRLYVLSAEATIRDLFGGTSAVRQFSFSHRLANSGSTNNTLATAVVTRICEVVGEETTLVLAAATTAEMLMDDSRLDDPWERRARILAIDAIQRARDGHISIPEMRSLVEAGKRVAAAGKDRVRDSQPLIPFQTSWHWLGTVLSDQDWKTPEYDDSGWSNGPARLGFGGDGEQTLLPSGKTTYYFRRAFAVTDANSISNLQVTLIRDDGAVVYLNEQELFRSNMPGGAIAPLTFASAATAGTGETNLFFSPVLTRSLLRNGTNVIAVEVHQGTITDSDLGFDLELAANVPEPFSITIEVPDGWSTIANNFARGSNTLSEVISIALDGTTIHLWDFASQSYQTSTFDALNGGWSDNLILAPGDGAWIQSPGPQGITFIRTQPVPPARPGPTMRPTTPGRRLVGGLLPLGSTFEDILGFPPAEGDGITFFDDSYASLPAASPSSTFLFSNSLWTPHLPPLLAPGKAAFIDLAASQRPTIVTQPDSLTVDEGLPALFSVLANGTRPLAYEWRKNGAAIPGATASEFGFGQVTPGDEGTYSVRISNLVGSVVSSNAVLTVRPRSIPTNCVANLLVNGSFELPGLPDEYRYLPGESTFLTGWKTLLNGVEYADPRSARPEVMRAGVAADGAYTVDLGVVSFAGAGIEQTFPTRPNQPYHVSFKMGTYGLHGRDGTASLTAEADWGPSVPRYSEMFTTANEEGTTIAWSLKRFSFTTPPSAAGTATTLRFTTHQDGDTNFVILDDVRVTDCCLELIGPPLVTVKCQIPNGAPVAWTVVATNHCNPTDLVVTCSPSPGSWFPPGTTMVTCVASGSGVTQTFTFPVIVEGSCGGLCEENLLANGSFEQPGRADGYLAIPASSASALLPGWTVVPEGVEYFDGAAWHPSVSDPGLAIDGSFAIDLAYLTSTTGGGVEQYVPTIRGEHYVLNFSAGTAESFGRLGTGRLEVSAGLSIHRFDLEHHGRKTRWERFSIPFVAGDLTRTLIKFTTPDDANLHYVYLDDVRLTRCPSPCVPPPPDLVYWLPFDEASGLTAYNAVGATYNGRRFNGAVSDGMQPARLDAGHVNRALHFDGLNDWVGVGDFPAVNVGTNDFTFDAWIRLAPGATNGGPRLIAGKFRDGGEGLRFGVDGGYLFLQYNEALAIHYWPDAVRLPADGEWHLVAVTVVRGAIRGGQFYIDGVATGSFDTLPLAGDLRTPGPLGVGGLRGRESWWGDLDEFEFFRRSLRPDEIRAIFEAGSAGKCRTAAGVAWDVSVCPPANFADLPASVRNFNAEPRTLTYEFRAVPCAADSMAYGLAFEPATGSIAVPGFGQTQFPVRITLPAELPCGVFACYELVVSDTSGVVAISTHRQLAKRCNICVSVAEFRVPIADLLQQAVPPIRVSNPGTTPLSLSGARWVVYGPDMQIDRRVVSLNGQTPGPLELVSNLTVPAGSSAELALDVRFLSFQPAQTFTVVLEADLDQSGSTAIASFELVNYLLPTAPPQLIITGLPDGSAALSWSDEGAVLEQATSILGPWTETTSETTNLVVHPRPDTSAAFYRLRR